MAIHLTAHLVFSIIVIVETNFEDNMTTLTPAYGRDYTNAKDAKDAWIKGKDWQIADVSHAYDGKYTSIRDVEHLGTVRLRFNKLADFTVV